MGRMVHACTKESPADEGHLPCPTGSKWKETMLLEGAVEELHVLTNKLVYRQSEGCENTTGRYEREMLVLNLVK